MEKMSSIVLLQVLLEHSGISIKFAAVNVCLKFVKEVRARDKGSGVITL